MQTTGTGGQPAAKSLQVSLVPIQFPAVGQKDLEYMTTKPGFNVKGRKDSSRCDMTRAEHFGWILTDLNSML